MCLLVSHEVPSVREPLATVAALEGLLSRVDAHVPLDG